MRNKNEKIGMGTMQDMMKEMGGMPEMCMKMMKRMTGPASESANAVSFSTPEMKGLFEEWVTALEGEIIAFVKEKGRTNPSDIAAKLKISKESVFSLIGKMAGEGKIIMGEIQVSG